MPALLRTEDALDWDYLDAYPELFGLAVAAPAEPPREKPQPPDNVAWQAADWMASVLGKLRKILTTEHRNALYVQKRIDAWTEAARDLGVRVGLYQKRLDEVERGTRYADRRRTLAEAWRDELRRQSALAAEAAAQLKDAAEGAAQRRRLLQELIVLQKQANEAAAKAAKRKKKPLFGALKKPKGAGLKAPGKIKLKFKPLS